MGPFLGCIGVFVMPPQGKSLIQHPMFKQGPNWVEGGVGWGNFMVLTNAARYPVDADPYQGVTPKGKC